MDRRRALFQDGSIGGFRQYNFYYVLRYLREGLRASIINGILSGYRTAIYICTQDCFGTIGRIGRRLYPFFRLFDVLFYPPVFRISIFIVLASLVIGSVDRLVTSCRTSYAMIRDVIHVRVGRQELRSDYQRTSFVNDQIVVDIRYLEDRRPFVLICQFTNFNGRFIMVPFINALSVYPMEVVFSLRYEVVFPFVEVACFCVRNYRFLRHFFFNQFARPFRAFSAFSREDLRILRRYGRAFFNDDQRMLLCVRLSCRFTGCAVCNTRKAFPTELRFFLSERYSTMRVRILYFGVVT